VTCSLIILLCTFKTLSKSTVPVEKPKTETKEWLGNPKYKEKPKWLQKLKKMNTTPVSSTHLSRTGYFPPWPPPPLPWPNKISVQLTVDSIIRLFKTTGYLLTKHPRSFVPSSSLRTHTSKLERESEPIYDSQPVQPSNFQPYIIPKPKQPIQNSTVTFPTNFWSHAQYNTYKPPLVSQLSDPHSSQKNSSGPLTSSPIMPTPKPKSKSKTQNSGLNPYPTAPHSPHVPLA
jgi:hypothetical protein